jgi:ribonuclease E
MEKQESKSKWDDLARELGAEISPETQQREEAASTAASEMNLARPSDANMPEPVRVNLPKRSAADWDSLAGELGLSPVETAPSVVERVREESSQELPGQRPAARRPREDREASRKRPDSPRERHEPATKRRAARAAGDEDPLPSRSKGLAQEQVSASSAAESRDEPAKPSTAVSLWHKIFGSPAEQSEKLTPIPPPSEKRETAESAAEVPTTSEIRSLSGEDVTAAPYFEEYDPADQVALKEDDVAPAERGRGRSRRRRRGRGRHADSRRSEHRPAASESIRSADVEDDLDLDDEFGGLESDDEVAHRERPSEGQDGEGTADDPEGAANGSHRSKAAQRSIPSWEEAIGFIVDSNMQSRSQRRPAQRGDSRGKPSRGRSRGRRKT